MTFMVTARQKSVTDIYTKGNDSKHNTKVVIKSQGKKQRKKGTKKNYKRSLKQ